MQGQFANNPKKFTDNHRRMPVVSYPAKTIRTQLVKSFRTHTNEVWERNGNEKVVCVCAHNHLHVKYLQNNFRNSFTLSFLNIKIYEICYFKISCVKWLRQPCCNVFFFNNVTTSSNKFVSAFLFQVFLMKFAFLSELLLWNYLDQPIFSKSNGCKKKLKLANQLQIKTER